MPLSEQFCYFKISSTQNVNQLALDDQLDANPLVDQLVFAQPPVISDPSIPTWNKDRDAVDALSMQFLPDMFWMDSGQIRTNLSEEEFNRLAEDSRNRMKALDPSMVKLISEFMEIHSNSSSVLDAFYQFRINAVLVEMNDKYPRCLMCGKLGFHPSRDNEQEFRKKPWSSESFTCVRHCGAVRNRKDSVCFFFLDDGTFRGRIEFCHICGKSDHAAPRCRSKSDIFGVPTRLDVVYYKLPDSAEVIHLDDLTSYVNKCAYGRRRGYDQEYFISKILTRCLEYTAFKTFPLNYNHSLPPKEVLKSVYGGFQEIRCFKCGYSRPPTRTRRGPENCSEATKTCDHPDTGNLTETPFKVGGQLLNIECEVCGRDCFRGKCCQRIDILGFEIETYK
jgi:hypothetical protein